MKFNRVILFVGLGLILLVALYIVSKISYGLPALQTPFEDDRFDLRIVNVEESMRRECTNEITYCFSDNECTTRCIANTEYMCTNGICRNKRIITSIAENKCDASKGFIAYLMGDVAFGKYEYICRTVDPGIAISPDESNRMCLGGDIDIDYLKQFPSMERCSCNGNNDPERCVVPATENVRRHVVCDARYGDMLRRALANFNVYLS